MLVIIHSPYILENALATTTPLIGHAWWKAWQNRLLAGWIMSGFQIPIEEAYKAFAFICCFVANVLTYNLYRNEK